MSQEPKRVLFVCLGNICRSPAAEGVFRCWLEQCGWAGGVVVDSAGTLSWHTGKSADERMRRAARARGYELTSRARQVRAEDLHAFDLVVAMDRTNLEDLRRLANGVPEHIRLLGSFLKPGEPADGGPDVPDPYYGGPKGFQVVLDLIEAACPGLLTWLLPATHEPRDGSSATPVPGDLR